MLKTWRFALHFAFAFNMSKSRGICHRVIYHLVIYHLPFTISMFNGQFPMSNVQCSTPQVETRGLGPQCRAGSRLSSRMGFTETRELQHPEQALPCEPRSTADLRLLNLRLSARFRSPQPISSERRCSLICLACAELHLGTSFCFSSERRCSSRTFRYGYLVTT